MGSVATLQSVCSVIRLNVGDLFNEPSAEERPVLRFADAARKRSETGRRRSRSRLRILTISKPFSGISKAGGDTGVEAYIHGASEEILLVIEGEVEVTVNGSTKHLRALDSLNYKSDQPHRVAEATGARSARVVWMMAPPTY
jgi:mannose-6-phosphate isomerase-like protein (cupin superfamily)